MLRYGSVCSGIEAISQAWEPLGMEPAWFSEIDPFACAYLAHHYPSVHNRGDMTRFAEWPDAPIDILVGGTPCQSFSVAGLRGGMADPRGNLALVFLAIADRFRPRYVVWENVPGVLSSGGGWDFGSFLGGLAELGYGWAYRVLDAQYFGVAQRRRRVFVVGHPRAQRAAAVLFERASLCWHPPPSREAGQGVASAVTRGLGSGGPDDNKAQGNHLVGECFTNHVAGGWVPSDGTLLTAHEAKNAGTVVAHPLRASGFDASEDGTGRGTPLIPFDLAQVTSDKNYSNPKPGDPCHPLAAFNAKSAHVAMGFHSRQDPISEPECSLPLEAKQGQAVGIDLQNCLENEDLSPTLGGEMQRAGNKGAATFGAAGVRRLTPRECERLQGFPDDATLIPYRGKPAADGPRYRALGNSMAVPVVAWIGRRILAVDAVKEA